MLTYRERYNLSPTQIKDSIQNYINSKSTTKLYVSALFTKQHNGSWELAIGKISTTFVKPTSFKYSQCILISKELQFHSYSHLFDSLFGEGLLIEPNYPLISILKSSNTTERLISSFVGDSDWPVRRFEIKVNQNIQIPHGELIGFGVPFFKSIEKMLEEYTGIPELYLSNSSDRGQILIDVEDHRARLLISNDTILTEGTLKHGVVGYYMKDEHKHDVIQSENSTPNWKLDEIDEYEVFLVTEKNEVIDFANNLDSLKFTINNKSIDKYSKEVEQAIDDGEGEKVEFKTDIDLRDLGGKVTNLEKSVCALSNHKGGKLIFGVNDDGEVVGVTTRLRKQYKNDINGYIKDIIKRLNETLSINSCFEVNPLRIRGQDIIVVDVSTSGACNSFTADNMVYIRRGASSKKASPHEWHYLNSNSNIELSSLVLG